MAEPAAREVTSAFLLEEEKAPRGKSSYAAIGALVLKRVGISVFVLFVVSLIIFLGIAALPGDAAQAVLGQQATPDTIAAFRRELGLDQPLYLRYVQWLANFVQGDLGTAFTSGRPVAELINARLGNSLLLAFTSACLSVPLALALGVVSAIFRNTATDRSISIGSLVIVSFPEFFIGYILVSLLAVYLGVLPAVSTVSPEMSFIEKMQAIALPSLTLTLTSVCYMMRMTRAAIINTLSSPYIEMARLKGLSNLRIILFHALPNALSPIINVVILILAYLVVGVVVVEVVFVYPGLGQLLVDSVTNRDLPVVQAVCILFAAIYVTLNLMADVLSILSNPRLWQPK